MVRESSRLRQTEQDLEVQLCEELQSLQAGLLSNGEVPLIHCDSKSGSHRSPEGREEQLEQLALQLCTLERSHIQALN